MIDETITTASASRVTINVEGMMAPIVFPPGAMATLNSGGPLMSVIAVESKTMRQCSWFNATEDEEFLGGSVNSSIFPVACLIEYKHVEADKADAT